MTDKKVTTKRKTTTTTKKAVNKVVENKNTIDIKNKFNDTYTVNLKAIDYLYHNDKKFIMGEYKEYFSLFISDTEIELTKEQYNTIKEKLGE